MDALKALAALRAAGSLMVLAYAEVKDAAGNVSEGQLMAAEVAVRTNTPSAGAPPVVVPTSPGVVTGTPIGEPGWPHYLVSDGVGYMAYAPINPAWRDGSMTNHIYGSQGAFILDPSNGVGKGVPIRSPGGFPLVYTFGADGAVIGTATIRHDNQSFSNDEEVASYIARGVKTPAQLAAEAAEWEATYQRMREQGKTTVPPVTQWTDVPID